MQAIYFLMSMGYFYAIAAAISRGLVYTLDQKFLDKISPSMLTIIHSVFFIIVLTPILLHSKEFSNLKTLDPHTLKYILFTLIFGLAGTIFIYLAIQQLGSAKAAIFEIAYPFFVVIFSIILFNTQINGYFILGALFLFVGAAIIVTLA